MLIDATTRLMQTFGELRLSRFPETCHPLFSAAGYLELAKSQGVNALVTISNQFTSSPEHHPIKLPARARGKIGLYHWSWMFILTQADLLVSNVEIDDEDQQFILNERIRFLTHPSAGVKGFDSLRCQCWYCRKVERSAPIEPARTSGF